MNKMKYIIVVVTFYTVFIINQQIQYNSDIILAVMTNDSHRRSRALTPDFFVVRTNEGGKKYDRGFVFLNIIFHKLRLNYWHYCDQLLIFIA